MKRQVTDQLRGTFRPEFLNRVDEVIVFHALTDADLAAIVGLLVADLQRRIAANDLVLEVTPAALAVIQREGTDPAYGARPLKRTIQRLVENPFARAMLGRHVPPGRYRRGGRGPGVGDARVLGGGPVGGRGPGGAARRAVPVGRGRRTPSERARPAGPRSTCRRSTEPNEEARRRAGELGCRVQFGEALRRLEPLPGRPARWAAVADADPPRARQPPTRCPAPRRRVVGARPAAVLVLLYPDEHGEACVVLTERTDRGGHHSGEVSFPGGRAEPEDADLEATALREAAEEVGVDPVECGLRVVGRCRCSGSRCRTSR